MLALVAMNGRRRKRVRIRYDGLHRWLVVVAVLATSACAARTRTPSANAPPAAHLTTLDGRIVDGRYVAADGTFSVAGPHPPDSYEFKNLRITDGVSRDASVEISYVIFGPGPSDPAGYHVIVADSRRSPGELRPFAVRADMVASSYMKRYDQLYHGQAERLAFAEREINGKPAIYSAYRYSYGDDGRSTVFYVVFTIIGVSDRKLVNVMAEKLTLTNPWHPSGDALVAGEWTRFNDFVASVDVAK